MRITKPVIFSLILLVLVCSLYRIIPCRPWGFAPQIAMAVFSGAIFIKNKKWAFALPLLSMFLSDVLYQVLYNKGWSSMPGFYEGQWQNYLLFSLLTTIGFFVKKLNITNIFIASLAAPTVYFILSNFMVWLGGGGLERPKTFSGLLLCYNDGLPFYKNSIVATFVFSAVLFGGYYFLQKTILEKHKQLA